MKAEILVVPKNGQGHLFPCMELCKHLVSRNYKITLIIDSDISSSVPTSLRQSPLFEIAMVVGSSPSHAVAPGSDPFQRQYQGMTSGLENFLTRKSENPSSIRVVCAVIDHIMFQTQEVFAKFGIPTVTFITSGACWAAMQHAVWKAQPSDMKPGEIRELPGLPKEVVLKYSDLKQRSHWRLPPQHGGGGPPGAGSGGGGSKRLRGPPLPGDPAPWVAEVESSIAILINTCDDLERPFLDYVANLTGKPVWGVGPLLPDQYWQSADLLLGEREIRPKRDSNYTQDEIIEWLDSKPRGSVFYVSFGSEVSPSMEEYPELSSALEESKWPFIWVIQKKSGRPGPDGSGTEEGYFPHGLDSRVGKRGLIIHGWAPQLLILSHPSTGGFLSHCGWNSTVEAIVRGVPFLAWPIRGDQYYNAKLLVSHLKVGTMVSEGYPADMVKKDDIVHGIETVMTNEEIRKQAATLRAHGFPASSVASLDAFGDFINQKIE
uniref:Glycosyltransferase n=1 Tax=Davidia involucrata TaxID=16924 RepID=A0A5B6Z4U5_DAVIN